MSTECATTARRMRVLHLCGSRQDSFYHDLSILYARACAGCPDLDFTRYEFLFAHVSEDGRWSFPDGLGEKALAAAPRMSTAAALAHLGGLGVDVMVPHMFCVEGMTRFRSTFDLLQIPFVGNREYTIWPATDKALTKQMLEPCGVPVPQGEVLERGVRDRPQNVKVPVIVKPCNEDNSRGITLVRREEELNQAIDYAFSFDSRVVVEQYIAGRELRVAVVEEEDGSLTVLPKMEYFLEDIRTASHKLQTDKSGKLMENAIVAAKKDGDRQCPAECSDVMHARIDEAVKKAHRALSCRHYSLFDLRVDADEQPYVLEACLFCSFSPLSVIPAMASKGDREDMKHPHLFHRLLERTVAEGAADRAPKQAAEEEKAAAPEAALAA